MRHIETMLTQRKAQELVVGYPVNMNGTVGFKAKEVDQFVAELEKRFRLPIHRIDERLSSHSVKQGLKNQKNKPAAKVARSTRAPPR